MGKVAGKGGRKAGPSWPSKRARSGTGEPEVLRAVSRRKSAAVELRLQGAAHAAHSVRGAAEGTEGAGALAADDGFRHRVLLFVLPGSSAVWCARLRLWKHLSTVIKALASTLQKTRNGRKRRYIWRHRKDKTGNAAPQGATVVNVTGEG